MTTIKINDIEYNIPRSWDDITIRQQIEISKVRDRDDDFKNLHLVSTYTGIPLEIIRRMNINQFKSIIGLMPFISQDVPHSVIKDFTFNGETYHLLDSILQGQTQDFLSIEGVLKKFKNNQVEALPYIIAIVAKKKGETLDQFDVWKRGEQFMDLPYPLAQSIWFFFAQTEKTLSINTAQFLAIQDKVLEASLSYSENTLKRLDGLPLSKRLLRTTLLYYIRSTRKDWKNFWTGTQSVHSKQSWIKRFQTSISNSLKPKKDRT